MKYGFVVDGADVHTIGEITEEAEAAGWDGVFIADAVAISVKNFPPFPLFDPWVVLTVMAMRSKRLRIGTLITPVSRRRPWKLAHEAVAVDHVSNGRLTIGVGMGAASDDGAFFKVGEEMDLKIRAQRVDEGLAIIAGLWTGKPFSFKGDHYRITDMTLTPSSVQAPRIPIWVVGVWPKPKSMLRAVKWDGIIPQKYKSHDNLTPAEIKEVKRFIDEHRREDTPFDIIVGGKTPGSKSKKAAQTVRSYEEAGATWWLENVSFLAPEKFRSRIKQGPPAIE
jgi:hypothetical protein